MTDLELMNATIALLRTTRNPDLITVLSEVQSRLAVKMLAPVPKGRPSRAAYMRAYRNKKNANPFM